MDIKEQLKGKRVLVDFYATWCGPCKLMDKQLEKYTEEVSEVALVKINVDENTEASTAFGVRSLPTLIYMENGEIVNRAIGAHSLNQLKEFTNVG